MRPYKPSPQDELEMMDGSARDVAGVLNKIQVNEYWSKSFLSSEPVQKMERYVEALKNADAVSLHVPLTAETKHLISKKELAEMKKSAILINTARGAVVDEAVLVEALQQNWIGGAGLDVFEDETRAMTESEKILYGLPNVVLTPHIASATVEARSEMSRAAAQNIIEALAGRTPKNVVSS